MMRPMTGWESLTVYKLFINWIFTVLFSHRVLCEIFYVQGFKSEFTVSNAQNIVHLLCSFVNFCFECFRFSDTASIIVTLFPIFQCQFHFCNVASIFATSLPYLQRCFHFCDSCFPFLQRLFHFIITAFIFVALLPFWWRHVHFCDTTSIFTTSLPFLWHCFYFCDVASIFAMPISFLQHHFYFCNVASIFVILLPFLQCCFHFCKAASIFATSLIQFSKFLIVWSIISTQNDKKRRIYIVCLIYVRYWKFE